MNRRDRRAGKRHGHTAQGPSLLDTMGMTRLEFERSAEELVSMGLVTKEWDRSRDPNGEWRYRAVEGLEIREAEADILPFKSPE